MSIEEPSTQHIAQPQKYVGFDTITTQIENRLLKRDFNSTLWLLVDQVWVKVLWSILCFHLS